MKCYAITHTGLVREGNEDSCYIPENGECFAIVCDGMGGHNAGEVASGEAIKSMCRRLREEKPALETLHSAILSANSDVYNKARGNNAYSGMGTTLTAVWWTKRSLLMGHVGDSRLYKYENGALTQLSHDHTLVQELVDMGEITPQQARVHPRKNIITRAIGTQMSVEIDLAEFSRRAGVTYMLCSDGLTNMVEDDEICAILGHGTPQERVNKLLEKALEGGGTDNITAVLVIDSEDEA